MESEFIRGESSQGMFSIAFTEEMIGAVVGGDYRDPATAHDNITLSSGGSKWEMGAGLSGYRSGVCFVDSRSALAVGTNGADLSIDCGQTWRRVSTENFNAVSSKGLDATYAVGPDGAVYKINITYILAERSQ